MKTTTKSLKDLYVQIGGSLDDSYDDIGGGSAVEEYTNIPDCIDAIAKVGTGSGGTLVAESDNGTVTLKVR